MNKNGKFKPWPFKDPPNVAVFTVRQIMHGELPILQVCHDADDRGWQFLTGEPILMSDAMLVALSEVVDKDAALLELSELPLGWNAKRNGKGSPWKFAKTEESDT